MVFPQSSEIKLIPSVPKKVTTLGSTGDLIILLIYPTLASKSLTDFMAEF